MSYFTSGFSFCIVCILLEAIFTGGLDQIYIIYRSILEVRGHDISVTSYQGEIAANCFPFYIKYRCQYDTDGAPLLKALSCWNTRAKMSGPSRSRRRQHLNL